MEATQILSSWRQEQWTASKEHDLYRWSAEKLQILGGPGWSIASVFCCWHLGRFFCFEWYVNVILPAYFSEISGFCVKHRIFVLVKFQLPPTKRWLEHVPPRSFVKSLDLPGVELGNLWKSTRFWQFTSYSFGRFLSFPCYFFQQSVVNRWNL